jgi:hypothetical protein
VAEPVARAADGLFAFLGGGEAPERPHRVKITDEDGTATEVFVPQEHHALRALHRRPPLAGR